LTKIKEFQAEEYYVCALAVHPTLPYLLSSSRFNLIKLWDWDQGWICTRKFSSEIGRNYDTSEITFNPKDANSFASAGIDGINVCDSLFPLNSLLTTILSDYGPHFCVPYVYNL
ncbi:hypothetical protein BAE44_0017633, partial [Dichanthelium oligosanthes]